MQPIIITAFFTTNSIPTEILTPTIRIRKISDASLAVTDEIMTSIGEGQYAYSFTPTESNQTYTVVCDGGESQANSERYSYASIEVPAVELVASFTP